MSSNHHSGALETCVIPRHASSEHFWWSAIMEEDVVNLNFINWNAVLLVKYHILWEDIVLC